MASTVCATMVLLLSHQALAKDYDKPAPTYRGAVTLHLKNEDIGYPTDGTSNNFSKKQANYIPETGKDFFVFPQFEGEWSPNNTGKRYMLDRINIVVSLCFADGSVIGNASKLPGIGQKTSITIPYEKTSKLENISYLIQGRGAEDSCFTKEGRLRHSAVVSCETLGAAWASLSYTSATHFYAYVEYPYSSSSQQSVPSFHTFFGNDIGFRE